MTKKVLFLTFDPFSAEQTITKYVVEAEFSEG